VLGKIVDLGMAIMARSNAVISFRRHYLVELNLAVCATFIRKSRLEESSPSATAEVVRLVGPHFDKIFFPHNGLYHVTQIVCHWIPEAFAHDLTRVLHRELDLSILVPVGVDLELSFSDPFGVILIDARNLEVIRDFEFLQSFQD